MSLGVCHAVCVSAVLRIVSAHGAAAASCISLDGEGNALYPRSLVIFYLPVNFSGVNPVTGLDRSDGNYYLQAGQNRRK